MLKMYEVGEIVLYGSNGVCKIEEITEKTISKTVIEYYVLKPIATQISTLFVPTQNEKLVGKMRKILAKEEIEKILENLPETGEWNKNKSERFDSFKKIILDGNCLELIGLIRLLHNQERKQMSRGKRLHITDEKFLKEAERMVYGEISVVLGVDKAQAKELVLK